MKPSQLFFVLLAAWAIALLCVAAAGAGAACDATQLTPCAGAVVGNAAPTAACCSRMKEQRPCLCQYARDPNLQRYVNSPSSKKAMAACEVPAPTC